jgi:hypothetical protein
VKWRTSRDACVLYVPLPRLAASRRRTHEEQVRQDGEGARGRGRGEGARSGREDGEGRGRGEEARVSEGKGGACTHPDPCAPGPDVAWAGRRLRQTHRARLTPGNSDAHASAPSRAFKPPWRRGAGRGQGRRAFRGARVSERGNKGAGGVGGARASYPPSPPAGPALSFPCREGVEHPLPRACAAGRGARIRLAVRPRPRTPRGGRWRGGVAAARRALLQGGRERGGGGGEAWGRRWVVRIWGRAPCPSNSVPSFVPLFLPPFLCPSLLTTT